MGLRNAFKNFRKTLPKESKRSTKRSSIGYGEPHSKYLKVCDDQPDIDEEEYEAATKDLKAEYKKILEGSYGGLHHPFHYSPPLSSLRGQKVDGEDKV